MMLPYSKTMKAFLLVSLLLPLSALADDFTDKFKALKKKGDKKAIEEFLEKSSTKEAKNPNYYATAGNYWWGEAKEGGLQINPLPAGNFEISPEDLSITDPKTGKKVGKIGSVPKGKTPAGQKAIKILADGAKKFPHRADLALGLAHLQKETKLNAEYVDTLTALLAHAKKSPKSLKWMDNGKLPKPAEQFLPETIQTYTVPLFNANTPATDKLCGRLLDAVTDTYPDHPFAYNLKAALADANGKPAEALKMLEIAHQKKPDDPLILSNLAATYGKQGQKKDAIKAYEKLLKLKIDAGRRAEAEAELKKIKSN